jgi:hypothetical protein
MTQRNNPNNNTQIDSNSDDKQVAQDVPTGLNEASIHIVRENNTRTSDFSYSSHDYDSSSDTFPRWKGGAR